MLKAPTNITEDQFMFSSVTGRVSGQKAKNQKGVRNISAPISIATPYFPRDHLRLGSGPCVHLQIRQLMVIQYDERVETTPRELIALSANAEPRLMRDSKQLTTIDTHTARRGIFQPAEIYLMIRITYTYKWRESYLG